jgi:hypothetical protein
MFRFQLEIAGFLAGSAVASAFTFWFTGGAGEGDRKIQLPMREDENRVNDPFDVTAPMDFVDGYPIDEPEFWAKVRELYLVQIQI